MPLDLDIAADIAEMMTQTVTIEALPDPQPKGRSGSPKESNWTVERADVPCLIIPRQVKPEERAMQPANVVLVKILFDAAVELGTTRRVIYDDPVRGRRVFRPEATRNIVELNQAWFVDCQEVTS